jgi:hypothetical protein
MNSSSQIPHRLAAALTAVVVTSLVLVSSSQAKQGATDPIPGTSKGATNSGGGGGGSGKSSATPTTPTVVLPPAPPPAPFVAKVITFTKVSQLNGTDPVCSGDYHIDPYYPTLSLMTVNADVTLANVPNGTALYLKVNGTGGTLYPFTSNIMTVNGGTGLCTYSVYVTPGTVISSVDITDAAGTIIATGI